MARMTRQKLKELISDALIGEEDTDYQDRFQQALAKWNVASIGDLSDDEKKEFFNYLDASYTAKDESVKLTKNDLKQIIKEEYVKLTEGKNALWRSNLLNSKKLDEAAFNDRSSNWYEFAKAMDMNAYDLSDFAHTMKFKHFDDMDRSINPSRLFARDSRKFIKAIKDASVYASMQNDNTIKNIIKKTSG